jgi:four helix bundle protein
MPIFVRTFDLLIWLVRVTKHFPSIYRHTVTQRLLNAAFDLSERLEEANFRKGSSRLERLDRADEALQQVRLYLRLVARLEWLSKGQYLHAARMTTEIGRLLGGWRKSVHKPRQ